MDTWEVYWREQIAALNALKKDNTDKLMAQYESALMAQKQELDEIQQQILQVKQVLFPVGKAVSE